MLCNYGDIIGYRLRTDVFILRGAQIVTPKLQLVDFLVLFVNWTNIHVLLAFFKEKLVLIHNGLNGGWYGIRGGKSLINDDEVICVCFC